jgi:O-antigen ligase
MLGTYCLWFYCLYHIARRPGELQNLSSPTLFPLAVFSAIAILSAFANSISPMYSLWRSFETIGVLLWGGIALNHAEGDNSPRKLFNGFYTMSLIMLMGVILTIVRDPGHAWMIEGRGVHRLDVTSTFLMGANSIGVTAALLTLAMAIRFIFFMKSRYLILLGPFLMLCYAARSRTGFIVLTLGMAVSMFHFVRLPNRRWITAISIVLCLVLVMGLVVLSQDIADSIVHTFTRGQSEENLKSLDGRVSIWTSAVQAFEESPILGSGYGTYPTWIGKIGHFHNVFIELAVTTGILGLTPMVFLMILTAWRLVNIWFGALKGDMSDQLLSLDAVLIGAVLMVSNMTTAGTAYYSWHMIGTVVLMIALHKMLKLQRTAAMRIPQNSPMQPHGFMNLAAEKLKF